MKRLLTSLLLLLTHLLFSQQNTYNVFEIGKGEILKNNYAYLDYLHNDLLIAAPIKEGVNYDHADLAGIIDIKENIILPFQYRNIEKVRDDYNIYKEEPLMIAISNGSGRALYRFKKNTFEQLTGFNYLKFRPYLFNGNYLTAYNGYCQILNLKDGSIIKTRFNETEPLTDNLIATKDMDYKWGIFNKKGDTILTNQFDKIRQISDSLVFIEKRDSIGVINNDGTLIIPPIFKSIETTNTRVLAQTFNSGRKITINPTLQKKLSNWTATIKKDGKIHSIINSINDKNIQQIGFFGAFDSNGKLIIPFNYALLERGIGNEIIANKNGKFGIISENENLIIDFKYDEITPLFNTFYVVKNDEKYGLFISNGKKLLDVKYGNLFTMSKSEILFLENNFWYKISYSNKFEQRKIIKTKLNPDYSFSHMATYSQLDNEYHKNMDFFVVADSEKYGIMNKNLNIIISVKNKKEPRYFDGKYFDLGKNYTVKGIELVDIDLSRNYYDDKVQFKNTIIAKKAEKYGVVDMLGKIIIPFQYAYIQNIDGIKFIVTK